MSLLILPRRFREQKNPFELGLGIKVGPSKFKAQVCRDGKVIREPFGDRWFPNLITNNGLDQMCQGVGVYLGFGSQGFLFAARVGTGTNPPAVSDTALQALTQSTATFFTGGTCSSVNDTVNGACTTTVIFEFAAVGAPVGLNELGLNIGSGGTAICTRALFPSTINLNAGDNLRLTYAMTESIPAIVTPITVSLAAINGFNLSGSMKVIGSFGNIFGAINANGTIAANGNAGLGLHFQNPAGAWMCSAPTTFPAVNVAPTVTNIATASSFSQVAYTNGSFTRSRTDIWNPSTPGSTVSNVIGFFLTNGAAGGSGTGGLYLLLSSAQTKANTNTLTITTSITVSRV